MAIKKAIDSIGKQSADPIDANFLNGIVTPLGRVALVVRQAKTRRRKSGTEASMSRTRRADTRSDASDISSVALSRVAELTSACLALIF
jgi:hypothetical protein